MAAIASHPPLRLRGCYDIVLTQSSRWDAGAVTGVRRRSATACRSPAPSSSTMSSSSCRPDAQLLVHRLPRSPVRPRRRAVQEFGVATGATQPFDAYLDRDQFLTTDPVLADPRGWLLVLDLLRRRGRHTDRPDQGPDRAVARRPAGVPQDRRAQGHDRALVGPPQPEPHGRLAQPGVLVGDIREFFGKFR